MSRKPCLVLFLWGPPNLSAYTWTCRRQPLPSRAPGPGVDLDKQNPVGSVLSEFRPKAQRGPGRVCQDGGAGVISSALGKVQAGSLGPSTQKLSQAALQGQSQQKGHLGNNAFPSPPPYPRETQLLSSCGKLLGGTATWPRCTLSEQIRQWRGR